MTTGATVDLEPCWIDKTYSGKIVYDGIEYTFQIKIGQHYPTPYEDYMEAKLDWDFKRSAVPRDLKKIEAKIVAEFLKAIAE